MLSKHRHDFCGSRLEKVGTRKPQDKYMNGLSLTECHKRVRVTYGQDLALDLPSLLQFDLFSEDRLWTEAAARMGDSGRQSPGDVPNE